MDSDMDNATLRKVQLVQLEIAKEIDRICRENDIAYFLAGGTLLGPHRRKRARCSASFGIYSVGRRPGCRNAAH